MTSRSVSANLVNMTMFGINVHVLNREDQDIVLNIVSVTNNDSIDPKAYDITLEAPQWVDFLTEDSPLENKIILYAHLRVKNGTSECYYVPYKPFLFMKGQVSNETHRSSDYSVQSARASNQGVNAE